ncbi:MAG: 30S ribosomal protein S21 [Armatimonadota bacterium]|nr:30S ribosomal protein S21 [Armatimonadota bacterium]MDR5702859.1 30S ribosomal protein S21 [Armatimonadota bacterium]MDR7435049.1 30S ribosomal protein S21 [Armatimonadota bacterium]
MPEVRVGKDESLDSALRRFKRQVKLSGILVDARRHEHYEKPSAKRRRKQNRRRRK